MSTQNRDPRPPRWLQLMNKVVIAVQKLGVPTGPSMVLTVPGRRSGQPRSTPVTPFDHTAGSTPSRAIPEPTGPRTRAPQGWARSPAVAGHGGSESSNCAPRSRGPSCGHSPSRCRWVSGSPSAVASSSMALPTNSRRWQGDWRYFASTRVLHGEANDVRGRLPAGSSASSAWRCRPGA